MSDEQNRNEHENEKCNCFCHSKGFRKFLIVALGTFVGVYCALSLFTALHRPSMMPCPLQMPHPAMVMPYGMPQQFERGDRFNRFDKERPCKCPYKLLKEKLDKNVPLKIEIDD